MHAQSRPRPWAILPLFCLAALPGCDLPSAPEDEPIPSELELLLTDSTWILDSVAPRTHLPGHHEVSILAARRFWPSSVTRSALFGDVEPGRCADPASCLPDSATYGAEMGFELEALSASPAGDRVAFQGAQPGNAPYVYLYDLGTGILRPWVAGLEPCFTPAGEVVYVSSSRNALLRFDPDHAQNAVEREGVVEAANPTASPDGRFIAYSGLDGTSDRRIFVHDHENPRLYLPVSGPDHYPNSIHSLDGADDDCPAWSPGGRLIAFRARLAEDRGREAIFITRPQADPVPVRIATVAPREHITQLDWEPSAERILAVVDGKLWAAAVPSTYQDR
jgi:Tol biopolymer transport system component